MNDDLTELDHYQQLREWAKGLYPLEAATELLIRTGWARPGQPWLRPFDDNDGSGADGAGHWIDSTASPTTSAAGPVANAGCCSSRQRSAVATRGRQ